MAAQPEHASQGSEKKQERTSSQIEEQTLQVVEMIDKKIRDFKVKSFSKEGEPEPCIYRVPDKLRQGNGPAYTPRVVSIGPLHHNGEKHLSDMEEIKVNYMNRLFEHSSEREGHGVLIRKCAATAVQKLPEARSCYKEDSRDAPLPDVDFAKMMLTDGAFIIELLWTSRKRYKRSDDPIFGNTLKFHNVRHDLQLLENQIPFFVLDDLFNLTVKKLQSDDDPSLSDFILEFFDRQIPARRESSKPDLPLHILGILHTSFMPRSKDGLGNDPSPAPDLESGTREDTDSKSRSNGCLSWLYGTTGTPLLNQPYHPIMKHSATELASAGVIFTPRKAEDLNVEFNTSCWFHLFCGPRTSDTPPCCIYNTSRSSRCFLSWFFLLCGKTRFAVRPLCVRDSTEPLLRNLIAFEQCYPAINQRYVTSYAFLMYTLIDDEADVELLEKAGVIQENLGARESTSKLFKDLCKEVVLADFSFLAQWKEVHRYCNSYSHTNLARVRRNCAALRKYYFSNRWAVISVIAAFILFTLQVIQTIYTIRENIRYNGDNNKTA